MKLASILSLVALVASPFSASSAVSCTVTGSYSIDDEETDPTNAEIDYAAYTIISSYNACHNTASTPGEAETCSWSTFTMTGESVLKQVQAHHPGEEKQVAENLRGKVGRYVYSAFLGALLTISCHLCGDDDDSVTSSAVTNAALSVVLEEKKLAVQKHNGLSMTDLEYWELAWCDELVGYGYPFDYAYGCVITIDCPTEDLK